jgi:excinuclease ABC subunit A
MEIYGARANNLRRELIRFPLQRLVGVCGVSGSGKSTLVIDTLGRALAPKKQTTSVAYEPVLPGEHDRIVGAPQRVILVDQARRGVHSPADFLELSQPLLQIYAESGPAAALGLDEAAFSRRCSACGGSGVLKTEMGFLPDVFSPCDLCAGTGFRAEAWEVAVNGLTLPELFTKTIEEVAVLFGETNEVLTDEVLSDEALTGEVRKRLLRPLKAACQVGLGYLALRQPGYALSGGEAQRLKIAKELCKKRRDGRPEEETLYILDEPTVGQHAEDVRRLVGVLRGLVQAGHSVLVVEHNPLLLAGCDWLIELGPGGGPEGGWLVAQGTPLAVAQAQTPTAPYLREVLEARR